MHIETKPTLPQAASLRRLILDYLKSTEFDALAPSMHGAARRILLRTAKLDGDFDVEDIDRKVIEARMAKFKRKANPLAKAGGVAGANLWLQTMRGLYAWAYKEDRVSLDPTTGVKYLKRPRSDDPDEEIGARTPTEDDLAKFEQAYPLGTLERTVYATLLYTGFRVSDAARFDTLAHFASDGTITLVTKKRRIKVEIPLATPLKNAVMAGQHARQDGVTTVLTTVTGQRWTASYLGWFIRDAFHRTGINCSAHSLRKAAARRFVEAGYSITDLMAWFGWKTEKQAVHYSRRFNRKAATLKMTNAWKEAA